MCCGHKDNFTKSVVYVKSFTTKIIFKKFSSCHRSKKRIKFFFRFLNFFFSKFERKKKGFSKSNSENSESAELNFHYYMIFDVCRTTSEEKKSKKIFCHMKKNPRVNTTFLHKKSLIMKKENFLQNI